MTTAAVAPNTIPKLSSAGTVLTMDFPKQPVAGIINLLSESQLEVKCHAIRTLNSIVDYFWPEIADITSRLEHFALDATFPEHQLAALVLSKVFFHMEKWDESIRLALLAGPLFDIGSKDEFNRTILTKAIDRYVADKAHNFGCPGKARVISPALEETVERMIKNCLELQDYKQIIGIAIDSCRLDVLQTVLRAAEPVQEHLKYAQRVLLTHTRSLDFQQRILGLLIEIAEVQAEPDYIFVCDCLVSTQDVSKCSSILGELLQRASDRQNLLTALQIAFNIYEVGPEFAQKVCKQMLPGPQAAGSAAEKLHLVLSGKAPCNLQVKFLSKSNSADLLILEKSRETLNLHNSMHHSAIYYANALMHAGSTNDEFLRKNMEWLSYASNWAKFGAAASLGVIHRGHIQDSSTVLAPYLPKPGATGSPYAEGGALFALGLIHSKAEPSETAYLREQLVETSNEIVQHGAALGLAAAAMATHDGAILDDLRGILYADNAVSGEAAAASIGLVMAGSLDTTLVDELLHYARETQHEKIIRSLAVAVALINYGAKDKAEGRIDEMLNDKDGVIRFGGVWTVAMAYAGTSDNRAVSRLLHAAVSESDDNVRRAAVIALGFVMFKSAAELPQLLELLSASYNPHVRYGAALALGIAFCGTADKEAIELIKPMCKDLTDFVRQGAYLALAMILMQVSEAQSDQVAPTRKMFETVAGNKYEDAIARFGAILAQGLIDAGGRNAVITLAAPGSGHNSLFGICGMMMFCQFWYWYPSIAFVGLALQPTGIIGVDETLDTPAFEFTSAAAPKLFAYPEAIKTAQAVQPKKLTTAVLSTTAKAAARARKTGKALDAMDVDEATSAEPSPMLTSIEPTADEAPALPALAEPEPTFGQQENLSRVTLLQRAHVLFGPDSRFVPATGAQWAATTITVVRDTRPGEPVAYLSQPQPEAGPQSGAAAAPEDVEMAVAAPPEPFEEPDL